MCWLNGRPPGHVEMGSVLFDDDDDDDDERLVLWNKRKGDEQNITNNLSRFSPKLV